MGRLAELDRAFRAAAMFDPAELRGEYRVRMLSLLPSLHRLGHRKLFRGEVMRGAGAPAGTNLFFRSRAWAEFFVEEGRSQGPDPVPVVVINYDLPANPFYWRVVRDHVRAVAPGRRYLGRLNVLLGGSLRFLAYFSLEKLPGGPSPAGDGPLR